MKSGLEFLKQLLSFLAQLPSIGDVQRSLGIEWLTFEGFCERANLAAQPLTFSLYFRQPVVLHESPLSPLMLLPPGHLRPGLP